MFEWLFRRNVLPLYNEDSVEIIIQSGWISGFTDIIMDLLEKGKLE